MPLIKRLVKGSPLTFAEGDANLDYLENLALNNSGFPFSGSAVITGSLLVSGSVTITGSVNISGSLNTTASWAVSASQAISSSYATTASYALNGGSGTTYYIATGSVTASVNVGSTAFQITSGSNTLFLITSESRVGIGGITSPNSILHVSSSFRVTGGNGRGQLTVISDDSVQVGPTSGAAGNAKFVIYGGTSNGTSTIDLGHNGNYAASIGINDPGDLIINPVSRSIFMIGGSEKARINNSGNVAIGTTVDSGHKLYISGSGTSGSFNANNTLFVSGSTVSISGSFAVVSGSTEFQVLGTGIKMGNSNSDAHIMTGSFRISGTGNTGSILTVIGSGSINPIFTVQGSQGELFSVTDSLTGSLFSVNDISGLPILDVNSDQTTKIGSYLAPGLYASTRVTANTGVTVIYSIPTSSYDSAYFDYNIRSGSVGRAGSIIAMWSGSSVNYSEVSASSFGTTNTFVFGVRISGSNMILSGSAPSNGWTVKTIIRSI